MKQVLKGATALGVAFALLLSACGDDDSASNDDTASTSEDGGGGGGDAAEVIAPFLEPSTSINIDTKLERVPDEGIKVAWLEANIPGVQALTPGYKAATEALGWDLTVIPFDLANPQTADSAVNQAVDLGVDYIAIAGPPTAAFSSGLAAAAAKGIPVIQDSVGTEEVEGVLGCVACDTMLEQYGALQAGLVISDSGGGANVVFVTIPELPALASEGDAFAEAIEACADCTFDTLESSMQSLTTGQLPSEVVSYLQQHPDVEYLAFAFGQGAAGVKEALATAGIGDGIKLLSADPDLDQIQGIIDGSWFGGVMYPVESHTWVAVDAMARHSIGMDPSVSFDAAVPTEIWMKDNVPSPAQKYQGPKDYESQFRALWGV